MGGCCKCPGDDNRQPCGVGDKRGPYEMGDKMDVGDNREPCNMGDNRGSRSSSAVEESSSMDELDESELLESVSESELELRGLELYLRGIYSVSLSSGGITQAVLNSLSLLALWDADSVLLSLVMCESESGFKLKSRFKAVRFRFGFEFIAVKHDSNLCWFNFFASGFVFVFKISGFVHP